MFRASTNKNLPFFYEKRCRINALVKERIAEQSAKYIAHLSPESANSFGARLRLARAELGLSQKELAGVAGIPHSTQKKYEGSHSEPGRSAIDGYVRAGISANWLVSGIGPMLLKDMQLFSTVEAQPDEDAHHMRALVSALRVLEGIAPERFSSGEQRARVLDRLHAFFLDLPAHGDHSNLTDVLDLILPFPTADTKKAP